MSAALSVRSTRGRVGQVGQVGQVSRVGGRVGKSSYPTDLTYPTY